MFFLALVLFSFDLKGQTNQDSGPKIPQPNHEHKEIWGMSYGDWAAWATALGGIANVILVIYLFYRSDNAHKQERLEDFKNRETERKAKVACFWIEELIMRQNHKLVTDFFDEVEAKMKRPAPAQTSAGQAELLAKASEEIVQFNDKLYKIQHQLIDPLQWIHGEFQELVQVRNDIQDLYTDELSKIPGISKSAAIASQNGKKPDEQLAELRKKFFQTIHRIHTKVLLDETHKS